LSPVRARYFLFIGSLSAVSLFITGNYDFKARSSKKSIPPTWLFESPFLELTFTSDGCGGKLGIRKL
jgi:hypothetical protein